MTQRRVLLSSLLLSQALLLSCATTTTADKTSSAATAKSAPSEEAAAAPVDATEGHTNKTTPTASTQPATAAKGTEASASGPAMGTNQPGAHERHPLGMKDISGLSGLTTDGEGHLWAVSERDLTLVEVEDQKVIRRVQIDMKGEAMDFESITWLSGDTFALGTERDSARRNDDIVILKVSGDVAQETRRHRVSYDNAGGPAEKNRGLEAICKLDSTTVLVGSEKVVERDGARLAPIWRLDLATGEQSQGWLTLSSDKGKLAGLTCAAGGGGFQAYGVERHFGIMRIISFKVPLVGLPTTPINPTVRTDLASFLEGSPNLEGITKVPNGMVWLVVDNAYGRIMGPNEIIRLPTL